MAEPQTYAVRAHAGPRWTYVHLRRTGERRILARTRMPTQGGADAVIAARARQWAHDTIKEIEDRERARAKRSRRR